jgi:hypothetical protein
MTRHQSRHLPHEVLEALERYRDHHFRRVPARRIGSAKSALKFIEETGFCSAFVAGLGVPCLREAIVGEREPVASEHIQHDYGIVMTWRIKDELPKKRQVYYGKVIAGRPGFIARDMLSAFLRLRAAPGGHLKLYRNGMLSQCAKLVMDALAKRGAAETRALKLASGYAQARSRAAFDRAMKELQEKFLALKVDELADPFTYVWDSMEHRWPDALAEARALGAREAAYRIVRRYFEVAAFASERSIARVLGVAPGLVEYAARRLERDGIITRGVRIEDYAGELAMLREFVR